MKIDIKIITAKFKPFLLVLRRHFKFIFIVILVGAYGFILVRIGMLSRIEPSPQQVDETLLNVKRPRVDKDAVAKIQALEDQNVEVQTLFKQARDNPFQE